MIRRQQWLSAASPEDASASQEAPPVPAQPSRDKYGIDLNEFKMLSGKKPRDWKKAVRMLAQLLWMLRTKTSWRCLPAGVRCWSTIF